jgi:hypothetical protein
MKTIPTRIAAAVLLALSAVLMSCNVDSQESGKGGGIMLSGRVLTTSNAPVAGVIVALSHNGVKDTTDAEGVYELRKSSAPSTKDTVVYTKNGQLLARTSVVSWVDTLPDVEVVQRDISGLLTGGGTIARVEGVVTGDGIDSSAPVTSDFYYNPLTGNYSGFVYFPPASSVQNYQVEVNVYGPGDLLTGRSQLVPFTSQAGNVTVPLFQVGNAVPVAYAGADIGAAPSTAINLHGTAVDSFGTISTWEWSIGGASFVVTSSGDTSFSRATPGAYPCILRVTDNDGNQSLDTVVVAVLAQGITWTSRSSGNSSSLNSVVWTGTQFVAVGTESMVTTSPDGITWTSHLIDSAQKTLNLLGVAWDGTKLIVVTNGGLQNYFASSDGNAWASGHTTVTLPTGAQCISAADTVVFMASQGSLNRFFLSTSDHGATWGKDTLATGLSGGYLPLCAFTKHAGLFVGVGANGYSGSSTDGRVWTRRTDPNTFPGVVYDYTMTGVASTGSYVVAVGYAGNVTRSADGTTWEKPRRVAGIPEQGMGSSVGNLYGVAWTGSALFAVGNGYIVASADAGANWAQVQQSVQLHSLAWNGSRLVAVGGNGTILTSN